MWILTEKTVDDLKRILAGNKEALKILESGLIKDCYKSEFNLEPLPSITKDEPPATQQAREFLASSLKGEVEAFAHVTLTKDGKIQQAYFGLDNTYYTVLGAIEMLKQHIAHDYLDSEEDDYEDEGEDEELGDVQPA